MTNDVAVVGNAHVVHLDKPDRRAAVDPVQNIATHLSPEGAPETVDVSREHWSIATMVVEKHAVYRAGLVHILADTDFHVVADRAGLGDLPEPDAHHTAHLLLLGLDNNADGMIAQLSRWREAHGRARIIVLSERFSTEEALATMRAGASCYLAKDQINRAVLLRSLELVMLGALVLSGQFAEHMAKELPPEVAQQTTLIVPRQLAECSPTLPEDTREHSGLSGREQLILSHLMLGASNKHIARELGIAEATVKVHVKSLLRKIRVRNRTQAAMWGINNTDRGDPEP